MRNLPPITKKLLLINVICWLASIVFERYGLDLNRYLGLHYITDHISILGSH